MEIRTVGIIGAGMGGLLLAQILKLKCPEVRVLLFERDLDDQSRNQGYILGIDPSGMKALQVAFPNIADLKCPEASKAFNLFTKNLAHFAAIPLAPGMGVARKKLRETLSQDLHIEWGKKFVSYEETDSSVIAHFEDGSSSEPLDLLIGADGFRSAVRKARCPQLQYDSIDITSVVGTTRTRDIPVLGPKLDKGMGRAFGAQGSSILFMRFSESHPDEVLWTVTFPKSESFPYDRSDNQDVIFTWTKDHMESHKYHRDICTLINTSDPSSVWVLTELTSLKLDSPANLLGRSTRVTLLGDAAHSMTTHRGRGANTTFEDALDLATMIQNHRTDPNWLSALHEYENILFKRGYKNVKDSKNASNMITMTGWAAFIRDSIFCVVGLFFSVKNWFSRTK